MLTRRMLGSRGVGNQRQPSDHHNNQHRHGNNDRVSDPSQDVSLPSCVALRIGGTGRATNLEHSLAHAVRQLTVHQAQRSARRHRIGLGNQCDQYVVGLQSISPLVGVRDESSSGLASAWATRLRAR